MKRPIEICKMRADVSANSSKKFITGRDFTLHYDI